MLNDVFPFIVDDLVAQGFSLQTNCLDTDLIQALALAAQQEASFRPAGVGQSAKRHGQVRSDQIRWLETDDSRPCVRA